MNRDVVAGIAWVLFGLFLFWRSFKVSEITVGIATGALGPAFYPRMLAALVLFLAVIYLSATVLRVVIIGARDKDEATDEAIDARRVILLILLLVAYLAALDYTGFLITHPVLLALMIYVLGETRKWVIATTAVGYTLAIYVVFESALKVIFPENRYF